MTRGKGRSPSQRRRKGPAKKGPGTSSSVVLNQLKNLGPALRISVMTLNAGAALRKQTGPSVILLSGNTVQEQVFGAVVGIVTVLGGQPPFFFTVVDEMENGDLWEVAGGILKLKDTEEVFFADAATRVVDITATQLDGKFVTQVFPIAVQEKITPPPPPEAPTDIQVSGSTVQGLQLGAPVGTVTVTDPNLPTPGTTETITVQNDGRFVVLPNLDGISGFLQLGPTQQVDPGVEPTVTLILRATNGFGLFFEKTFILTVLAAPTTRAHSSAFSPAYS